MNPEALAPAVPFPQHPGKHRLAPLFTAAEFHRYEAGKTGSRPPRVPRNIVLVFGARWRRYLGQNLRPDPSFRGGDGVFRARPNVEVVRVEGPGAPHVAITIEEFSALGAARFLIVGLAGSLQPDLPAGSYVVCTRALRDEGTSHHYARPARFAYPSPRLTRQLRASLDRRDIPYALGPSWTIDAVYRETVEEVRRYRAAGIRTVEMEASAVFSVARYLGRESAALFTISDVLDTAGWEPRFHDTFPALARSLHLAVDALARLR